MQALQSMLKSIQFLTGDVYDILDLSVYDSC